MRRNALPLLFLVSCVSCASARETGEAGERLDADRAPFTSAHATLLDFELDGTLVADSQDPDTLRTQIEAQFLFTVGPLNAERSVAQLGQLQVWGVNATLIPVPPPPPPPPAPAPAPDPAPAPAPAPAPRYAVTYHARLPVAWGGSTRPATYSFTLPAKLGAADQLAFATKYGTTCVDPSVGTVDAGSMFLFYRPAQPGCVLATEDVATFEATVSSSAENTQGKYPEYHRVWGDNALEVVAMFSHEYATPTTGDEGVAAFDDFVWRVHEYLGDLQPNAALRSEPAGLSPSGAGSTKVRLAAQLRDGRTIAINVMLVGHALTDDGAAFDQWYDALTPRADLVLYNGHAGLGANVRTLMSKGAFVPGQYLIWFANGCDTFAYVDRTIVDRRALLNPDDPGGTKYMDTLSNVMAGYFRSLGPTSLTLLHALVDARDTSRAPKTYEQIFQSIDSSQIVVVTGEEDNLLQPLPPAPNPTGAEAEQAGQASQAAEAAPADLATDGDPQGGPTSAAGGQKKTSEDGCSIGRGARDAGSGCGAFGLVLALLTLRRRRSAIAR